MPRPSKRPHRAAVTRMLRSTGLAHMPEEAPLVEMLRTLADQLDQGEGSRARMQYLSALKDVRRVLNFSGGTGRRPTKATTPAVRDKEPHESPADTPTLTDLQRFKASKGIPT